MSRTVYLNGDDMAVEDANVSIFDLGTLSMEEMKKLQKDVRKAIDSFRERRQEALVVVEAKAKETGFCSAELAGNANRSGFAGDDLLGPNASTMRCPSGP